MFFIHSFHVSCIKMLNANSILCVYRFVRPGKYEIEQNIVRTAYALPTGSNNHENYCTLSHRQWQTKQQQYTVWNQKLKINALVLRMKQIIIFLPRLKNVKKTSSIGIERSTMYLDVKGATVQQHILYNCLTMRNEFVL